MSAETSSALTYLSRPRAEKEWMSRKEASAYLTRLGCKIAPKTLANMAANNNEGSGPSFMRNSLTGYSITRYRRDDLEAWVLRRMVRVP